MKKSIAALLAIALVLTSLFALNLIASAEGEETTTQPVKIASTAGGWIENQSGGAWSVLLLFINTNTMLIK